MFKFISKIGYYSIICSLLSGCYHIGNTSLHVKNKASQQLIQNTDVILITTSHPILENLGIFKEAKARVKSHLIERGYTVVDENISIKPNIFVLIEPNLTIQFLQGTQFVCETHFIEISNIRVDTNSNTYTTCYNQMHNAYTLIYDYNLTIYRPKSIDTNINQYIDSKNYKQNAIFSSQTKYKSKKTVNNTQTYDEIYANVNDKMYQRMTDAIFATYPLNQNSLVYFQNTPTGYLPTQIIKE